MNFEQETVYPYVEGREGISEVSSKGITLRLHVALALACAAVSYGADETDPKTYQAAFTGADLFESAATGNVVISDESEVQDITKQLAAANATIDQMKAAALAAEAKAVTDLETVTSRASTAEQSRADFEDRLKATEEALGEAQAKVDAANAATEKALEDKAAAEKALAELQADAPVVEETEKTGTETDSQAVIPPVDAQNGQAQIAVSSETGGAPVG